MRKSPTTVWRSDGVHLTPYANACRGDWADRDPSERVDYNAPVSFSDKDDDMVDGSPEDQLVED